jgi:hypothetical protein
MNHGEYPALFLEADAGSNRSQGKFLLLIRGEYLILFLAAVFSMNFLTGVLYGLIYAAVFFAGLLILIGRAQSKPEQWWYRCRALAESVKTLAWRYMMHATPFDGSDAQARAVFHDRLREMFHQSLDTAKMITNDWSGNNQITQVMEDIRTMNRTDRMTYYLRHRVDEQRGWYNLKSTTNRSCARFWVWASGAAYVLASVMVLSRIARPDWEYWPIEPLIVIAASIVGWVQIKKFNELATAYTIAAHEIGLIRPKADAVTTEAEFSEFVNDAEKAFSREHTLWIARQSD